MADINEDEPTAVTLSVGARVGLTLAALLVVAAGYLLWSPIQLYPADGFPIMCGSGARLPADDLGTAACGQVNQIRQWQAGSLVVGAVVLAVGSIYAFGVRRRTDDVNENDGAQSAID